MFPFENIMCKFTPGDFFSSELAHSLAKEPNPDNFWAAAVQAEGSMGNEVSFL